MRRLPGDPTPTATRLWSPLLRGAWRRLDLLAREARCSISTARRYVNAWRLAGYVERRRFLGWTEVRITPGRDTRDPPIVRRDTRAGTTHVWHPRDDTRHSIIHHGSKS